MIYIFESPAITKDDTVVLSLILISRSYSSIQYKLIYKNQGT